MSIFIIAEAGVNHNGDLSAAYELIDAAKGAGADAIKFQTFKSENLVTKKVFKANYQKKILDNDDSQFSMLKKLEIPFEEYYKLLDYCTNKGIQFLSTAFDGESLAFLVNNLGVRKLKISSGDLTNGPLLLKHARTMKDLIVSTGMANLLEIQEALSVIAFGMTSKRKPSKKAFQDAYNSQKGQRALKEKVTLLHCTSEYPAPFEDINLNAMQTMLDSFGLPVGYSDHTEGIVVSIAAAALGAKVLEKHFTLDKRLAGPDHQASLEPLEFSQLVKAVRVVELSLGKSFKEAQPSEIANIDVSRRSIVAAKEILSGDIFTKENLSVKRAGNGINPMEYWEILAKQSSQSYKMDELIRK